jgi:16S rRNA (cytosine967-C5)-methyltransferase
VSETVALAPRRTRGFVNAVLRKVSSTDMVWPSDLSRLSYPDWIGELLIGELGRDDAMAALANMNEPATVTVRDDGYEQDESSQWVATAVEPQPGERILDTCAAPGGKATALAAAGAVVTAADLRPNRVSLIESNAQRLGLTIETVVADATAPDFPSASFDAVLVDAPCSGLGALRRRPDARWRIQPSDVTDLVDLQRRIISASAPLVRPGGRLIYSVCTLTAGESIDHPVPDGVEVDDRPPPVGAWRSFGPGWRILPHDAGTDGMVLIRYRRIGSAG